MPGTAAIPVATLYSVIKRTLGGQGKHVAWPCRIEDLKAEIEGTLFATSAT